MELTASRVAAAAEEYEREEPLFDVESDRIDTLPAAFADGEFHWRDAEWVVRWWFRRFLGDYPDADRTAAEDAFTDNDYDAVQRAILDAAGTDDPIEKLDALTALHGIDLPVATAFLQFLDPDEFLVVGPRVWSALEAAGELDGPYPDPPTPGEYERYLAACRELCDRFDCTAWTLYRALWRLSDSR